MLIADFHIHSRFARGCSHDISIPNLEKYARIKGVGILGTGDFQHPKWLPELKTELTDNGEGVLLTKTGFPFILQTEISLMYSHQGKGRKVHLVILAPGFDAADNVQKKLLTWGRIDYDGRPIFGKSCPEFVDAMQEIDKNIEIIPAHVWTPYFGLFGSMSGFDSVEECFGERSSKIHALETGMSSDPGMNWRISRLDRYNLVSFSDMHSFWPWRIAREATVLDCRLSYKDVINAIRGNGIMKTIETDPGYGKYHFDGHRKCSVRLSPGETKRYKNICPVCGKKLTLGVLNRVEGLADRQIGFRPDNARDFLTLVPLSEIVSGVSGGLPSSKKAWETYNSLLSKFGTEFAVLLDASKDELLKIVGEKLAGAIIRNREGKIEVIPGFDGEYGIPVLNDKARAVQEQVKRGIEQKGLDEF